MSPGDELARRRQRQGAEVDPTQAGLTWILAGLAKKFGPFRLTAEEANTPLLGQLDARQLEDGSVEIRFVEDDQ